MGAFLLRGYIRDLSCRGWFQETSTLVCTRHGKREKEKKKDEELVTEERHRWRDQASPERHGKIMASDCGRICGRTLSCPGGTRVARV